MMKKAYLTGINGARRKMNDKDRDDLIKKMEALTRKVDGTLLDSLAAHLWINKCISVVREHAGE
jgi:hypothetical protein